MLETLKRIGAPLIAITGDVKSTLAQAADVALDCRVSEEACPMNLVPTASTTAALAMGDALAMAVLVEKGFKPEDFANLHPGGKLGKKLMRVEQLMHSGDALPVVQLHTADARRDLRDVAQGPGHDLGGREGRHARRHHHRRRPAPQDVVGQRPRTRPPATS